MHANDNDGFDPLDLEIIDRVYSALSEEILSSAQGEHEELRKRIFACAVDGPLDFETLHERVLATYRASGAASKTSTHLS